MAGAGPKVRPAPRRTGFTLIEVLLVVVILGILGSVAVRSMETSVENGRWDATTQEMQHLAWAIAGNPELYANGTRSDFGYVGDVGSLPPSLDALAVNPGGYAAWHGPYIQSAFAERADDFKTDAWGNPYSYSGGVSVGSGGSGGHTLTRQFAASAAALTSNSVQGVVTDGNNNPPGTARLDVTVTVSYPDGAGGTATASVNPTTSGNYGFASMIPQGLRTMTAVYGASADTLTRTAVVLPGTPCIVDFKFRGNLWGAASGSLACVAGTAGTLNGGRDITFDLRNVGSATVVITSLKAGYSRAPVSYYEVITWAGTTVADQSGPRLASGQTVTFGSACAIAAGGTATVRLTTFKECASGACNDADMAGATFTIELSDGSNVSFTL